MLIGSTNSLTPCDSNTWSPEPWPFSSIIRPYWNPEQPPPCTNTRRPLLALFSSASSSLIFEAAVSETLIMVPSLYQDRHWYTARLPMPYVTIQARSREKLLDSAQRRWDGIAAARPDLEPAVALQGKLIGHMIALAAVLAGGRLPRLSLPPKYLAAKLTRGVPALAGEPIPVPLGLLQASLFQLCDALAEGGAGESAEHIKTAIANGTMEAGSLLTASLTRN